MIKGVLAHCCHGGAWLALGAAALGALATARLVAIQATAPAFVATARVASAPDDRDLIDGLGVDPVVGIVTAPGWLATTVTRGAEIRELSVFLASEGFAALKHEAPSVRVLSAFHLLVKHPERAAALAPLLADDGSVIQVVYEDPARATTVRDLVVDMTCAVAAKTPAAARFLARAGDDPRRLAVRSRIQACLRDLGPGVEGVERPETTAWKSTAAAVEAASHVLGVTIDIDWLGSLEWSRAARGVRAGMFDIIAVPVSRAASWVHAVLRELAPAKATEAKLDEARTGRDGDHAGRRTYGDSGVTRI